LDSKASFQFQANGVAVDPRAAAAFFKFGSIGRRLRAFQISFNFSVHPDVKKKSPIPPAAEGGSQASFNKLTVLRLIEFHPRRQSAYPRFESLGLNLDAHLDQHDRLTDRFHHIREVLKSRIDLNIIQPEHTYKNRKLDRKSY